MPIMYELTAAVSYTRIIDTRRKIHIQPPVCWCSTARVRTYILQHPAGTAVYRRRANLGMASGCPTMTATWARSYLLYIFF